MKFNKPKLYYLPNREPNIIGEYSYAEGYYAFAGGDNWGDVGELNHPLILTDDQRRNRPYDGQPWTDDGIRGQQEVHGITMRDIKDCFVKAVLLSAPDPRYLEDDEFSRCWDYQTDPDNPRPTEYLLEKQRNGEYVSTKVQTGNWESNDMYGLDLNSVDPLAVAQNLTCEIEKAMGIFPNIPRLITEDEN